MALQTKLIHAAGHHSYKHQNEKGAESGQGNLHPYKEDLFSYLLVNLSSMLPLVSGPVISDFWLSVQRMEEYTKSTTATNFIQKQKCEAVTLEGSSGFRVGAKCKSTRLLSRVFFFWM